MQWCHIVLLYTAAGAARLFSYFRLCFSERKHQEGCSINRKVFVSLLLLEDEGAVLSSVKLCSVVTFSCFMLLQVLQGLRIEEHVAAASQGTAFGRGRLFKLRLQFFPEHLYPQEAGITFADVAQVFKTSFVPKLQVCVCTSSIAP